MKLKSISVLAVGLFFFGFFLFAAFVKLDQGLPVPGSVVLERSRIPIQHKVGGKVIKVAVSEGDSVRKGAMILELDDEVKRTELAQIRGQLTSVVSQIESRTAQSKFLSWKLNALGKLATEGYASELELKQLAVEQESNLAAILDLQQSKISLTSRSSLLETELASLSLMAPDAGQIIGLKVQTPGAVIGPGQTVCELVPMDGSLIFQAAIPPHYIDQVSPGQSVSVRFMTFADSPSLVVGGQVITVSSDVLADEKSRVQSYLARIELSKDGKTALEGRRLQPGMPLELLIKTGERSLLDYILDPLIKRSAVSLTER